MQSCDRWREKDGSWEKQEDESRDCAEEPDGWMDGWMDGEVWIGDRL